MATFSRSDLAALRSPAKQTAVNLLNQFMRVDVRRDSITALFGTLMHQLAFARVLEGHLLKALMACPDRALAAAIEEQAAAIAGEIDRETEAAEALAKERQR